MLILFHHVQRILAQNEGYHSHCTNITCYFLPLPHIFFSTKLLNILNPLSSSLMFLQPHKRATGNTVFFILHAATGDRKIKVSSLHNIFEGFIGYI
jgi:uncharacterized membrane protein YGL010W